MSFVEDSRKLLQDFVTPELRTISAQLEAVEKRYEALNYKIESLDARVEKRFDQTDKRFDQMDKRLDGVSRRFERRFDDVMDAIHGLSDTTGIRERLARIEAQLALREKSAESPAQAA